MSDDLEFTNEPRPLGPFQAALFDFDGTLSLLRQNWQQVMVPMMVQELRSNSGSAQAESQSDLESLVWDFVTRLTGKQTIHQMIRLAEEVAARGGDPATPLQYKHRYHDLLWEQVKRRIDAIETGGRSRESMQVRGSMSLLRRVQAIGCTLYLASGTDLNYVREELRLLGLDGFFEDRVFGALDDYRRFSKGQILQQIIESGIAGESILCVGDGYVEIEETRKVGGFALGVASNEDGAPGVNPWKRQRLIEAGAHVIVPDYENIAHWWPRLFPQSAAP